MRRRILLLVIGVIALVLVCAAVPLAILVRSSVGDRAGQAAVSQANDVARTIRFSSPSTATLKSYLDNLNAQNPSLNTSVTLSDGTVLGEPPPADARIVPPEGAFPTPISAAGSAPATPAATPSGGGNFPGGPLVDRVPGGGGGDGQAQLRPAASGQVATTVVPTTDGRYLVQVYISDADRYSGVYRWWALLAGVGVLLLLIGAGVAELFTRRIVRPLTDTARTANRIEAGDLTARAPTDGPREIAAVGEALNALADRIDALIAEERETVADLSHRLRTPLTALRLDAESLQNPAEAERIGEDVSAFERTLTAVIRAARRPQREGRIASADLTPVVTERVEFWSALAEDQGRTHTVEIPEEPVFVRASAEDLAAAVDALLENVIAHTPEGTSFSVRLILSTEEAALVIADDGPGLPADAAVRGRSDRGSTGLGLDIARRSAEAGGGSMEIGRSANGGASITLHFVRVRSTTP
ncbi:Signal transduction histidine kinase [Frankineae bacterium MT45]|nr:Signal transduction histidine kinase [Frankineae bacterium MT45]